MMQKSWIFPFEKNTPLFWAVTMGFAPWLLAPIAYGKWGVAAAIVFMSLSIAGTGFIALLYLRFFSNRPSLRIAFAPGMGIIIQSGLFYFAVRFSFNDRMLYWSICALGFIGFFLMVRSLRQKPPSLFKARHLQYLILISIAVCLAYFITDMRKNYVDTADGGFSFLHPDSTIYMTISAAVKNGLKPWVPTSGKIPIIYHYGSHAIAGSYAGFTGANLSDALLALAGIGLLALLGASFGLGALVTSIYGGNRLAGAIAGGAAVFLHDIAKVLRIGFQFASKMSGFRASNMEYFDFVTGSTAHFFYGHSTVWGSIGLIVILSLALWLWEEREGLRSPGTWALPFLSALLLPLNVFAGLAVSGTISAVILISGIRKRENWLCAALTIGALMAILWGMGVGQSLSFRYNSSVLQIRNPLVTLLASSSFAERMATLFWILPGFGIGLLSLGLLSHRPRLLLAQASIILAIGGFALPAATGMDIYASNLYILCFLYHFTVVCSAAMLSKAMSEWMDGRGTAILIEQSAGAWLFVAAAAPIFLVSQFFGWTASLLGFHKFPDGAVRILAPALTAIIGYLLWKNIKRSAAARYVSLIIFTCVVLLQIAGTFRQIYIYAFMTPKINANPLLVALPDELKGLKRLREVSNVHDLCATNRNLSGHQKLIGTTFQSLYTPLSERRFLIETPFPFARIGTEEVRSDNRLLFESRDAEAVMSFIKKHNIRYLVCAPGTDLALSINLPAWLHPIPDTGSLKIYGVRSDIIDAGTSPP